MYDKISIAFIDVIGLKYDGNTVYNRGLGGSESAVIFMAEELAQIGFNVTVINNCIGPDSHPGRYKDVKYIDLNSNTRGLRYDIVVGSRTTVMFEPSHPLFEIVSKAKLKVLWMHDTFCGNDHLVEPLTMQGFIDEIFTLSDFHTNYVTTSHHGPKRNFEVLKPRIWQTRNGIRRHIYEVDLKQKDPNLFVYNASVSKGMKPLLAKIWPEITKKYPNAQLKIIGGYYNWEPEKEDMYEKEFKELATLAGHTNVSFTGIITQAEIASILAKATYFIYPGAFPETFGISALESLAYNTPLITTRFGALEETAIDMACWKINYAIEPNSLYPHIDHEHQVKQFLGLVDFVLATPYILQQKQNYCNIVKDIAEWDTVALQWKQHFYKKLGMYLPRDEYDKVMEINTKVQRVFGRHFINAEDMRPYVGHSGHNRIVVITPFYNAQDYLYNCIHSVAQQSYDNYIHILIDDCSTDDSYRVASNIIDNLPGSLKLQFKLFRNTENKGAVRNQWETIEQLGSGDVIMLLDGDDSLTNNNEIFNYYNALYNGDTEFTYGSCWSMADQIPLIAQEYPQAVKASRTYRKHQFNWILPYTHLRTFKKYLANHVDISNLKDSQGKWFKAGGDGALFYALIEQASPNRVKCIQEIFYNYNDKNPLNDYKVNGDEQNKNAKAISGAASALQKFKDVAESAADPFVEVLEKYVVEDKKLKTILIAIPTAKYIEPETFRSIYNLIVPEGYKTQFQYFYGYNVEQVRNLIADWIVKGFDYLFAVDSDIAFPPDTLVKLLAHDKPLVSGVYIQRKPNEFVLELYEDNAYGGVSNIPFDKIERKGLVEIAGCGFGCVLVKKEVFTAIGYPQFVYKTALDHKDTVSEDVYFCAKAREKGFKLYADSSIVCDHIGNFTFRPIETAVMNLDDAKRMALDECLVEPVERDKTEFLSDLRKSISIPVSHTDYLWKLRINYGKMPKIIYDVGSCVLHWRDQAKIVWPDAEIYCFEAMTEVEELYQEEGVKYHIGVLSDVDGKEVKFYKNYEAPGGNSYYKENPEFSSMADEYYPEEKAEIVKTESLLGAATRSHFPAPDLLKIDVQGAELDILKGYGAMLPYVRDVILELPRVEYNIGSPTKEQCIEFMEKYGFKIETPLFSDNGADGDYHFTNTRYQ